MECERGGLQEELRLLRTQEAGLQEELHAAAQVSDVASTSCLLYTTNQLAVAPEPWYQNSKFSVCVCVCVSVLRRAGVWRRSLPR